jgi:hypothetical protein
MSLIVAATALAGFLASAGLLHLGVVSFAPRYGLAVVFA